MAAVAFRPVAALRVAVGARGAAIDLPLVPPFGPARAPRRVFRPRPAPRPAEERQRSARPAAGLASRVGSFAAALPDHPWLDRLVRGRVWIPLLGILLAGIVTAQVEILKLGATMGRALEQTTTLTAQNEQLRGNVAVLSDDQRIERLAGAMGLVLPPPGAVGYLAARPGGDAAGALGNIHAPDASAFVLMTAKNGAVVTGPGTSTLPPTPGAPAPPPAGAASAAGGATAAGAGTATGSPTATTTGSATTTTGSAIAPTTAQPATTTGYATSQPSGTGSQSPASGSTPQASGSTPQASGSATQPSGSASQPSGAPATGAAAIAPSQQSSGG